LLYPLEQWPAYARHCVTTQEVARGLRLLAWSHLPACAIPERFGRQAVPLAAYIAAFLVKLDRQLPTIGHLRDFLVAHPALVWALGFPLLAGKGATGFDTEKCLPGRRHFGHVLRHLPNELLQTLLDGQVKQLATWLASEVATPFGQTISLDTKHVLAWVKENNPKAYIKEGRFDKTQQPAGDPDCKVGCKRRHNRQLYPPSTPTKEGQAATGLSVSVGEFHWGYASGVVVTKVPAWGEFVLAEWTQKFDKGDTTYFFPLMKLVEWRLGGKPRYGTMDAAFDAFYVYDYFDSPDHDGFAAVPLSEKGGKPTRQFDAHGLPLCDAGLAMPLEFVYQDNTTAIIPYRRARHGCPLLLPQPNGQTCPIAHKNWPKGGCKTSLAHTRGARIRHQLDRDSNAYQAIYRQRTAVERVFSQAMALGIEQPKLRNQQAIANLNTLIYLLINLRAMHRVQTLLDEKQAQQNG
jgi:hypothetical protein